MNFDTLPEYLKEKWWRAAQNEYRKTPLSELKDYQLEALDWYWERMRDSWEIDEPQSYEEALLWHKQDRAHSRVKLERARRGAERAERWYWDWIGKRRSRQAESAMIYQPIFYPEAASLHIFQYRLVCEFYSALAEIEMLWSQHRQERIG